MGYRKDHIHRTNPRTIDELKEMIERKIREILVGRLALIVQNFRTLSSLTAVISKILMHEKIFLIALLNVQSVSKETLLCL